MATHEVTVRDLQTGEILTEQVDITLIDIERERTWLRSKGLSDEKIDAQAAAFAAAPDIEICPFDCDHCRE